MVVGESGGGVGGWRGGEVGTRPRSMRVASVLSLPQYLSQFALLDFASFLFSASAAVIFMTNSIISIVCVCVYK